MRLLAQVRSLPAALTHVSQAVDSIGKQKRRSWFSRFDTEYAHGIGLTRPTLPSLSMFEIAVRAGIGLEHKRPHSSTARLMYGFIERHAQTLSNCLVSYYGSEARHARGCDEDHDLHLMVGRRRDGYFLGIGIGGDSPGRDDLDYRAGLFGRIIDAAGLSTSVRIRIEGGKLFVSADDQTNFAIHLLSAETGGANPYAFDILGFPDLASATRSVEGVLDAVVGAVDCIGYSADIPTDAYETLHTELNGIATVWNCHFMGRLRPGILSITCQDTAGWSTPRRIPFFEWREDRYETFFQGDVMVTPDGAYIEITSNCGDMERLIRSAEEAAGVPFEPVLEENGPA